MIINNKLDKTFGTAGSFAGFVILIFGIYACFYSYIGITTIIVGAFLAFSNFSAKIDFENKRIKSSNNLFGIISVGYWVEVKPEMKLYIRNVAKSETISSISNRQTTQLKQDFRISLFNESEREIMAIKKFSTKESAEKELPELMEKLNLNSNI